MTVEPRALTAQITTTATADAVWRVVSDVRRTGEWSPECRRVVVLGPLRRGALLVGLNRRGTTRWATLSLVTQFEPNRVIGWRVLTNRSRWSYELTPTGSGCAVRQTRRTPRGEGRFALWFTDRFLGGQSDHDDELEAGMTDGLRTIAGLAETGDRFDSARAADQPV